MALDVSSLERAIARLEEGVEAYARDTSESLIRDRLVQRFEFTYEISYKMLRRYLTESVAVPEQISRMTFADIIRLGNEHGLLLSNWPGWKAFREMRARTGDSYDEATALEVVAGIPAFLDEARYLRDRLRQQPSA